MTPALVSAFEVYQKEKKLKKKKKTPFKKDLKGQDLKMNPLLSNELQKISKAVPKDIANFKLVSKKKKHAVRESEHEVPDINGLPLNHKPSHSGTTKKPEKGSSKSVTKKKSSSKQNVTGHPTSPESPSDHTTFAGKRSVPSVSSSKGKSAEIPETSARKAGIEEEKKVVIKGGKRSHQRISLTSTQSSIDAADSAFAWMINPIEKQSFFSQYWEKRPVHISRDKNRDYYSAVLSSSTIDTVLRSNNLFFGKNVDVTSYTDGERKTHNPVGRAQAGVVWDFYRNGCSVRLLNPQTYIPELQELNSILQELFGSFVGANLYLTPPNSQGFAPHYDDIEAFILQIEGRKLWRVYAPRNPSETLPRTSSVNFAQEDIGEPILEVLLQEGDMMYFPRGFIHQANTVPGHHSLHVTLSTYQRNSWADLLEKLVPAALANAIEDDEEFRAGMPIDILDHLGCVHSESDSQQRQLYFEKIKNLFSKLFDYAPVDAAADQIGKEFQHDALPPCLTSDERKCSVFENSDQMSVKGKLKGTVHWAPKCRIRLTRSKVLRLVSEEDPDTLKLYHSIDNSSEYHGEDPQFIEIPVHMGPAIEYLIHSYPEFVPVHALPLEEASEKVQLAVELWERGLVLTESPLPFVSEQHVVC